MFSIGTRTPPKQYAPQTPPRPFALILLPSLFNRRKAASMMPSGAARASATEPFKPRRAAIPQQPFVPVNYPVTGMFCLSCELSWLKNFSSHRRSLCYYHATFPGGENLIRVVAFDSPRPRISSLEGGSNGSGNRGAKLTQNIKAEA
jgi:hypothetical protein